MELYIVIIVIFFLLSRIRIKGVQEKTKFAIAMLFLYFLASMRSVTVGNDTLEYARFFKSQYDASAYTLLEGRYETGYLYLNLLIGKITTEFNTFLFVIDAFIYYSYYLFIKRYSSNYLLSVLLFFCFGYWGQTLNIIRLQLAISIYIYAYILMDIMQERKWGYFGIWGVFFQRISLTYLTFVFVPKKLSKKYYILSTGTALVSYVFFNDLLTAVIQKIPYYGLYLSAFSKYRAGEATLAIFLKCLMVFMVWGIAIIVYHYNKSKVKSAMKEIIEYQINMVYVAFGILVLAMRFNLLDRCAIFFELFMLVLIPNILKIIVNRKKSMALRAGIILLAISYFFIVNIYRPEWNHIYPYHTFLYD